HRCFPPKIDCFYYTMLRKKEVLQTRGVLRGLIDLSPQHFFDFISVEVRLLYRKQPLHEET
ncbi:MAG: hypothetical protein WAT94_03260, partial [Enterococcus aquimarinus]